MGRLEGKVAFITGAARGQGRSHALRMAEEGADIVAVDVDGLHDFDYPTARAEDLDHTVEQVEKLGRRIVASIADVRDRDALAAAVDAGVAELGGLNIVVANAGICPLAMDLPASAYNTVIEVNFQGVVNAVTVSLPHLTTGDSIIAIGSVAAYQTGFTDTAGPGGMGYRIAKRFVAQYVHSLAFALAPQKIRANVVHPTNCDTDMLHSEELYRRFRPDLENPTREDAAEAFPAMTAMGIPWVDPADISAAVVFLASDESRYISGMQLRVDAGLITKTHGSPW